MPCVMMFDRVRIAPDIVGPILEPAIYDFNNARLAHKSRVFELGSVPFTTWVLCDSRASGGVQMSKLPLLPEVQMRRLQPFFPVSRGLRRVDHRRVISGIIYVIRHGL
jgi:hypothetical protein